MEYNPIPPRESHPILRGIGFTLLGYAWVLLGERVYGVDTKAKMFLWAAFPFLLILVIIPLLAYINHHI